MVLQAARDVFRRQATVSVPELTTLIRSELTAKGIWLNPAMNAGLGNFSLHEIYVRNISEDVATCLAEAA